MTNDLTVGSSARLAAFFQSNAKNPTTGQADRPERQSGSVRTQGPATPDPGRLAVTQPGAQDGRPAELSGEELDEAVSELNDLAQSIRRELKFSLDEASGRAIIEVYDSDTEELIRQIPPEQVLSVIRHLKEFDGGLVQEKA